MRLFCLLSLVPLQTQIRLLCSCAWTSPADPLLKSQFADALCDFLCDACSYSHLTCKRGSVGQSEGLSIPRSSVRFRLKPDTSNSHEFELHRPSNKGTKLLLKVIKAIIIILFARSSHRKPLLLDETAPQNRQQHE